MVLEAALICIDNSDWARNGDFFPTRFEAQQEAVHTISSTKTNSNHQNGVGLLTMAGERVEVRITPTNDVAETLSCLHGVKLGGTVDLIRGIQTAQLALKHRTIKNQKQRIICFVGSPVAASEKQLVMIGKQLKKNNVTLDVISFGDCEVNNKKLKALHESVNSNDNCTFIECRGGSGRCLSEAMVGTAILIDPDNTAATIGAASGVGGATDDALNEFGVDPNTDPELYLALRLSLEEEQRRGREMVNRSANDPTPIHPVSDSSTQYDPSNGNAQVSTFSTDASLSELHGTGATPTINQINEMEGIDDELKEALLLSLQDSDAAEGPSVTSQHHAESQPSTSQNAAELPITPVADPVCIQQLLTSLPGVNVSDPRIQMALRGVTHQTNTNGPSDDLTEEKGDGKKKHDSNEES